MLTNESTVSYGLKNPNQLSCLIPQFLSYGRFEKQFATQTLSKYAECLNWIVRHLGDIDIGQLDLASVNILRQKVLERGVSNARLASIIFVLKNLLRFCNTNLNIQTINPTDIASPKRPHREVVFLSTEEIQQFIKSIDISFKNGELNIQGLRFRALVEILLGTGMRISEALSLNRDSIDTKKQEVKIIGKGNKERVVFLNDRAIQWVAYYLRERKDILAPLFITQNGTRLNRADVSRIFQSHVKHSGILKKITPHILRHSFATNLLFNGCPISHVKELLGHTRLETTCKHYLGLDKQKAKEAHRQFLRF